ncbi:hypothetical protein AJ80_01759 [Polytolypa hystricis UAMH7299]|uniref:G domain-containing protein n=1 Tax=Polytolypa hystricis (strain UAMH7299) TaxID=1447883 RepID=A0A2B7YZQ0_POLH7|nr:hypothetical protein AJ80_01759 [Polytolypa hystricis UAMH7299]
MSSRLRSPLQKLLRPSNPILCLANLTRPKRAFSSRWVRSSSLRASSSIGGYRSGQWSSLRVRQIRSYATDSPAPVNTPTPSKLSGTLLPPACPGCGAYTQWLYPEEAGFYTLQRRPVKQYLRHTAGDIGKDEPVNLQPPAAADRDTTPAEIETSEDPELGSEGETQSPETTTNVPAEAELTGETTPETEVKTQQPENAANAPAEAESSGETAPETKAKTQQAERAPDKPKEVPQVPICDRCNKLVNHCESSPIPYPPISYIQDIISESPYDYNHIYHVLDAADFPMSLIPKVHKILAVQPQRTQNRRSKTKEYSRGARLPVISFIITRSDLLGPLKENVDRLMPYIIKVLRNAVDPRGERMRLGNVHMVSAHRGWWTKEIKEEIRKHGGAVWLVGKTNVGKSSLISTVFPKDSGDTTKSKKPKIIRKGDRSVEQEDPLKELDEDEAIPELGSLLPPAQEVKGYPVFPIVSSRPGTTASPIRIPFGNKKGEVIDLPGLQRDGLDNFVKEEEQHNLIMKDRAKPERLTIKPGQSLLIGGLVRITPLDPKLPVLSSSFVPLEPHVTNTTKAIAMQTQQQPFPESDIAKEGIADVIASAGVFELNDDVTKIYGKVPHGRSVDDLPYRVMATDILVEGCGWIELVAQIRAKDAKAGYLPKVEVFSPEGNYIGSRMSMSAWRAILQKKKRVARDAGSRPRRSMKGVKKHERQR